MSLTVVFRVDASLQIGSGHVMRCLTFADGLKALGAQCHFISREHEGNLVEFIRQRGFSVSVLPAGLHDDNFLSGQADTELPVASSWLGCDWETDAGQTRPILCELMPDWLVVDHYAIDQRWEAELEAYYERLMVIDDLADRAHECDLLLDQNLGRKVSDYAGLVPSHCHVMAGSNYALLRPEFAMLRQYSLQRRHQQVGLKRLLVTMGGVDPSNATGQVLKALRDCSLSSDCSLVVVMGTHAPWLPQVREEAETMPWHTEVLVDVSNMAQLMADSDLAVGAAGSTSWERCCLGVPALMVALADNQKMSASALQRAQAAIYLGGIDSIIPRLGLAIAEIVQGEKLANMSTAACFVTDGKGVDLVLHQMRGI